MAVSKEWAFQRSFLRKVYNPQVNEYFRDIDDEILDDIDVPRKAAKRACLILPKESQMSAMQKQFAFMYLIQRVQDRPDIVAGKPVEDFDEQYKYRPHVYLKFQQDLDAVPEGYYPVKAEISFRLTTETTETITESELKILAGKIKNEFGLNDSGYLLKKGKNLYTYCDFDKGINLQLYVINKSEAVEVVQKICTIVNATYDSDKLTPHEPEKNSVNTTTSHLILGTSYKKPRWRPTANCRFRKALIKIHGLPKLITLFDVQGLSRALI